MELRGQTKSRGSEQSRNEIGIREELGHSRVLVNLALGVGAGTAARSDGDDGRSTGGAHRGARFPRAKEPILRGHQVKVTRRTPGHACGQLATDQPRRDREEDPGLIRATARHSQEVRIPMVIDADGDGRNEIGVSHRFEAGFEMIFRPEVIVIEESDVPPPSTAEPRVVRRGLLSRVPRQVEKSDPWVPKRQDHFLRVIRAGIPDDDQLPVRKGRCADRLDGQPQNVAPVERRRNDGHRGVAQGSSMPEFILLAQAASAAR